MSLKLVLLVIKLEISSHPLGFYLGMRIITILHMRLLKYLNHFASEALSFSFESTTKKATKVLA